MWVLFPTTVAVLVTGCYSKPNFVGASDGGPSDGRRDGATDGEPLPPCAWNEIEEIRTFLRLDEAGGAAVADSSMAGNGGTVYGAILGSAAKIGLGASFVEGIDARIQLSSADAFDNLDELTVCSWVYLDRLPTSGELSSNIVDKSLNGFDGGWNLYVQAAGPTIGFLTPWGHYVSGQPNVVAGEWMHVCATWDGMDGPEGILLYRNGVVDPPSSELELSNRSMRDSDSPYPLVLGRSSSTPPLYSLFGKLDEVFLYEAVLSPQAIKSLYQCP